MSESDKKLSGSQGTKGKEMKKGGDKEGRVAQSGTSIKKLLSQSSIKRRLVRTFSRDGAMNRNLSFA